MALCTVLLLGSAPQDPAGLVEQLRSDDLGARERAFAELEKLGAGAEAALRKAGVDRDPGTAELVRRLLRIIELERLFSPALKKARPDLTRRIAWEESAWTEAYVGIYRAFDRHAEVDPFPGLGRSDLEPLALPALRNAKTKAERREVCEVASSWHHRTVVPELLRLLREEKREEPVYWNDPYQEALLALEGTAAVSLVVRETNLAYPFLSKSSIEMAPRVVDLLRGPGRKEALGLLDWLAGTETSELPSVLDQLLGDDDPWTRKAALGVLGKKSPRRHAVQIVRALSDRDSLVRQAACRIVGDQNLSVPLDVLKALAQDKNSGIRADAMSLVEAHHSEDRFEVLRRSLEDAEAHVRVAAIRAMTRTGRREHAAWLEPALTDANINVQAAAIESLAALKEGDAIDALRPLANDPRLDARVRTQALETLHELKAELDADALVALVDSAPIRLAEAAAKNLSRIAPRRLTASHIDRLVTEPEDYYERETDDILVKVGSDEAAAGMIRLLEGEYWSRIEAGRAMHRLGRERIAPLLRARLKQPGDRGIRMSAQVLGNLKWEPARDDLAALLDHDDPWIRVAAIHALRRIGLGTHAPKVRARLAGDAWEMHEAAETLALHGDVDSIPELRKLMSKRPRWIAQVLFDLGDLEFLRSPEFAAKLGEGAATVRPEGGLECLAATLRSRESHRRSEAAQWIGRWGDPRIAGELLPLLDEPRTAEEAIHALIALEAQQVLPDLVAKLDSPDVTSRASALLAIVGLQSEIARPRVRALLEDRDPGVRAAAVQATTDPGSAPALVALLKDASHGVRVHAIEALERLGWKDAADPLLKLLDDPSESIRSASRRGLMKLAPDKLKTETLRRVRDPLEDDRGVYIELLSDFGAIDAGPDLVRLLDDPGLKWSACEELAELGIRSAAEEIRRRKLGRTGDAAVARLGDPRALLANLEHPDDWIRKHAAVALVEAGDRRGVGSILDLVERYHGVRFPCEWEEHKRTIDLFLSDSYPETLKSLNAVRDPGAWKKFTGVRGLPGFQGRTERVMSRLAAAAGFRLAWEGCDRFEDLEHRGYFKDVSPQDPGVALREVWDDRFSPWSYIVEGDVIRVLSTDAALAFWRKWWSDEQSRDKK